MPDQKRKPREFSDADAVRERVPLLVGIYGASGGGKTKSALRLATGMQRVTGGDIYGIDTEHRRMLHYADDYKFRHVPFTPPFSPGDYCDAIAYCVKKGASIVIVDSMSHEHEGPGGVLEWHEELMGGDQKKFAAAWIKPKQARVRLINDIIQMGCNVIFCFRAKQKLDYKKGENPKALGWMPIGGEEYLYEMVVNCLLYPKSAGVPTWDTSEIGERFMLKLPDQFKQVFRERRPLSEDIGGELAAWAAGGKAPAEPDPEEDRELRDAVQSVLGAPNRESLVKVLDGLRLQEWTQSQHAAISDAKNLRLSELRSSE